MLTGGHALLAQIGCAIPVAIGFVLPALLLLRLALGDAGEESAGFAGRFLVLARNSFALAALAATLAAMLALLLGFAARDGRRLSTLANRVVALEGGAGGIACSSGHAAQIMALFPLMQPGRNVLSSVYVS